MHTQFDWPRFFDEQNIHAPLRKTNSVENWSHHYDHIAEKNFSWVSLCMCVPVLILQIMNREGYDVQQIKSTIRTAFQSGFPCG